MSPSILSSNPSTIHSSSYVSEIDSLLASIEILTIEMHDNFEIEGFPDYERKEAEYRSKEKQVKRFKDKISYLRSSACSTCSHIGQDDYQDEDSKVLDAESAGPYMHQGISEWVHNVAIETSANIHQMAAAARWRLCELEIELEDVLWLRRYFLERKYDLLSGPSFEELMEVNDECIRIQERLKELKLDISRQGLKVERYEQIAGGFKLELV